MNRLPFPKYLNRPRLVLMFEEDQVIFTVSMMFLVLVFTIIFNIEFLVMVVFEIITFFLATIIWQKALSDNVRGYLYHFMYNLGVKKPDSVKGEEDIVPYGFERYFID